MNANLLKYLAFLKTVEYGSFTRAAAALMTNQPNVTRIIRRLESELRCALFFRTPQGVRLTPEGEKLYARVSVAVESSEAGEAELLADQSPDGGVVHVAASGLGVGFVLREMLVGPAALAKFPVMRYTVSKPNAKEIRYVSGIQPGDRGFHVGHPLQQRTRLVPGP